MTKGRRVLSEAWVLEHDGRNVVLTRPATGLQLSLKARRGSVDAVVRALREGQVPAGMARLALALEEHGVFRTVGRAQPSRVRGSGALAEHVRSQLANGRWRVGTLHVPKVLLDATRTPRAYGTVLGALGDELLAVRAGEGPCGRCVVLRRLGRLGRNGQDQTAAATSATVTSAALSLVPEALVALDALSLHKGEALVVSHGAGARRAAVLEHPDCERCSRIPGRRAPEVSSSRRAYLDPLLGPVEINAAEGRPQMYPLGVPFFWGSVYLSRHTAAGIHCVTTYGGIYAADPDPARRGLIALSEGVERLSVRGARAAILGKAATLRGAVSLSSLYGHARASDERKRRLFARAVDLHTGATKLLPLEAVAVGLPEGALPNALHRELFYTGAASHDTFTQAVVHGTVEVLKRDAFMIGWYQRRTMARIRWPKRPPKLADGRARYLRRRGMQLELFALPAVDVPLAFVLLRVTATRARGNWPRGGSLLVPAGGFTPEDALDHALGLACGQFVSIALESADFKDPLDPVKVRALAREVPFWPMLARYLDPANAHRHAFLGVGAGEVELEALPRLEVQSPGGRLRWLRSNLRAAGLDYLAVPLTDVPACRAGFAAVKVVIPGSVAVAPSRSVVDFALPRMCRRWPHATVDRPNRDPHPIY